MQRVYSFKEAAEKIGYKNWRKALDICKKYQLLDEKRFPIAPYKYKHLFEMKKVKVPAGFMVDQPFLTENGVLVLEGMLIVESYKMAAPVRSTHTDTKDSAGTTGGTGESARPSA